jgi:hypothetical protein
LLENGKYRRERGGGRRTGREDLRVVVRGEVDEIRFVEGAFGVGIEGVDAVVFGELGEEEGERADVSGWGDYWVGGWEAA